MNKLKKCPYCSESFLDSHMKDHLEYLHGKELRASLKRMKVAMPIILIGVSIVIGMIWMDLLK